MLDNAEGQAAVQNMESLTASQLVAGFEQAKAETNSNYAMPTEDEVQWIGAPKRVVSDEEDETGGGGLIIAIVVIALVGLVLLLAVLGWAYTTNKLSCGGEKRIADDGVAYSHSQFLEFYGDLGQAKWDSAALDQSTDTGEAKSGGLAAQDGNRAYPSTEMGRIASDQATPVQHQSVRSLKQRWDIDA